ncbi:MAG: glycoside hydrolase family 127 protein [Oscillospiraceae bacterium]|nr:glycoside hydrolase family 127 protein [Oscillospiraceae bacterium]
MKIHDSFWSGYLRLIKGTVLPFQWSALNDEEGIRVEIENSDAPIPTEKSHAIANLKIAAGLASGTHQGYWFQDTDVYKWLEGVGHILNHFPDKELETLADEAIDLIEAAMEPDGYLNTFYQLRTPELKFKQLHLSHEMYCCGHLIEAAVAYYTATGKDKILRLACKFADCIDQNFGPEEHKRHGTDGHQEIEPALVKLYQLTGEEKYLKLAGYLLDVRGPDCFDFESFYTPKYLQAYARPKEQETAEGHAVRMMYMLTGMAETALHTGDGEMLAACHRIWENITTRRMYITGGIGSTNIGEAFTFDYDLPNDTMYCETCASIGLIYFARAMLNHEQDSRYADVMERALYNNALAGMGRDGKQYFYVNPLESFPAANQNSPNRGHVKSTRPDWFGCACCPPNLARTVSSIEKYMTSIAGGEYYTHLYIGYESEVSLGESSLTLRQEIAFDHRLDVTFTVDAKQPAGAVFNFRIPGWSRSFEACVNGKKLDNPQISHGYLKISKVWSGSETVTITFDAPVLQVSAHPFVRADAGKVAIQKGPFVYCLEEADNGDNLHLVRLTPETVFTETRPNPLYPPTLVCNGERLEVGGEWEGKLYACGQTPRYRPARLTFVPYYSWANRGVGEMLVWVSKR